MRPRPARRVPDQAAAGVLSILALFSALRDCVLFLASAEGNLAPADAKKIFADARNRKALKKAKIDKTPAAA